MLLIPGMERPAVAKINEYLTVGEAAELLGVSRDTLRRWDRAGRMTARRHPITGYRLYLRRELESLLKRIRNDGSSGQPATKRRSARRNDGGQ